jgi:vitamin B12 transporter
LEIILYIAMLVLSTSLEEHSMVNMSAADTIRLADVVVTGKSALRGAGFLRTPVNPSLLLIHQSGSISELLSAESHLYIKSYGPGGIATISFRGAGSSHTVVRWNGINLNNPMLGQSDFLTLPVVVADRVTLFYGGATVASGTGGLGGVVEIETKPQWHEGEKAEINYNTGSYGRHSISAIARYGKGKVRFITRAGLRDARNDFSYINRYLTGDEIPESRTNASFKQKVLLQELFVRGGKSVTGVRLWIQETDRQIPVPMNISPENHDEKLINRFQRIMVNHDHAFRKITWSTAGALSREVMIYSDYVTKIYSHSVSLKSVVRSSLNWQNGTRSSVYGELTLENDNVVSENYADNSSRTLFTVSGSADHKISEVFDSNIGFAIPVTEHKLVFPDLSLGIEIAPFSDERDNFRLNIATKSRIPTMNDLYWNPGGNPELETERALNSEISASLVAERQDRLMLKLNSTLFRNRIWDMIFWQPGESGIWSPVNLGEINSGGIELTSSVNYKSDTYSATLRALYSYTVSGNESEDKFRQLIYVPKHAATTTLHISYGRSSAEVSYRLTGRRFITTDNRDYLPAFGLQI